MKRIISILLLVGAVSPATAVSKSHPLPDLAIPQCFGVNIHFNNEQLAAHIAWLKKAGIGWVRRDMTWSEIERTKGVYDFAAYDGLIDALHDAGIRMLFILDYGNPNYDRGRSPASAEARAAFSRFAAAAAKRYAGRVDAWEIFNEPNIENFWKPKPNAGRYIALANEATEAMREAVPNAVIVGPALSGPFLHDVPAGKVSSTYAFLDRVLKSKAAHEWDAVTIHPYRSPKDGPETAMEEFENVRKIMQAHGIDPRTVPVIASEWGYSTFIKGVDEDTQGAYAVREFLLAGIERMPFSIWYDWQDDSQDASNSEYRFGLLRSGALRDSDRAEKTSKPAFNAVQELSGLLQGYRFDALITNDGSVMVSRYVKAGQAAWAGWSVDNTPHTITIALPPGHWRSTHILRSDAAEITSTAGQRNAFRVDKMPVVLLRE